MISPIADYCLRKKWITPYRLNFLQICLAISLVSFLLFHLYMLISLPYTLAAVGAALFFVEIFVRLKFNVGLFGFLEQLKESMTLTASKELLNKAEKNTLSQEEAMWLLSPGLFRNAADFTAGVKVPLTNSVLHFVVIHKNYNLLKLLCAHADTKDICKLDFKYENILHKAVVSVAKDNEKNNKIVKNMIEFIIGLKEFPELLAQENKDGDTPLALAEKSPDKITRDILLQAINRLIIAKKKSGVDNAAAEEEIVKEIMRKTFLPQKESSAVRSSTLTSKAATSSAASSSVPISPRRRAKRSTPGSRPKSARSLFPSED